VRRAGLLAFAAGSGGVGGGGQSLQPGIEDLAGADAVLPSSGSRSALWGAAALFDPQPPARVAGRLAFSAAAWRVGARDGWIGWSDAGRRKNLNKVVCNSRFLILPQVRVKNLASHVLGLSAKGLAADWHQRYGYEPLLLETFVDRSRYQGICYRAANWQHVGRTRGRGRQDREHRCRVAEKDVYVYALGKDVRQELCAVDGGRAAPEPKRRCGADWADVNGNLKLYQLWDFKSVPPCREVRG